MLIAATYRKWVMGTLAALLAGFIQLSVVGASQAQVADSTQSAGWRFSFSPFYWASAIAGSLTLEQPNDPLIAGNYVVDIGASEKLNPGFAAFASAGKGRWGVQVGVAASSVADSALIQIADTPQDSIPGYYDFGWSEVSLKGTLRVGPYLSPYVTIYAGIRTINWTYDLFDDAAGTLGNWDEMWIDPLIGASTKFSLGAGFGAHAHVDAAGFKIGGSALSWTVSGGLDYHVSGPLSLVGTYAYKEVSYDNGKTGDALFVWKDGVAQGWFLGAALSFPGKKR